MYSDAKKINLIEKLRNTTDETTWAEVEKALAKKEKVKKPDWSKIAGMISEEDAEIMHEAVAFCRQIHPDDWK